MTLLDLDHVAVRAETCRFDVLDVTNTVIGVAAVDATNPPTIDNNVERTIRRTLDGVNLLPRPAADSASTRFYRADIDTIAHRLRPSWLTSQGEYPLGVFLFGDASRQKHTWGIEATCRLVDQCLILDQPIEQTIGYPAGTNLGDILAAQATAAGITQTRFDATNATIQQPIAWPPGQTHRIQIFEEVCAMAGFLSPYFANDGYLVCRAAPLSNAVGFTYALGTTDTGRVVADSITESDDLLSAPNRYIAIDTGATGGSIVGTYDIPDTAPHSISKRGFVVATQIDLQGLTDVAAAQAAAQARYAQDGSTYRWLSFTGTPEPRHDTFDYVSFDGDVYREQSWSLQLTPGGEHKHNLRRTYF